MTDRASHFGTDWDAPLPLGHHAAVRRGVELRERGWTYPLIADAVALYHGFARGENWWRKHLRDAGVPPAPRGIAFSGRERAAAA